MLLRMQSGLMRGILAGHKKYAQLMAKFGESAVQKRVCIRFGATGFHHKLLYRNTI